MEECLDLEEEKDYTTDLMEHQKDVLSLLDSGKILWGGVGAGKSRTVLAYYMMKEKPRDIYVITTAKKRDSLDWVGESAKFGIGTDSNSTIAGVLTVDSWNNIGKYLDVENAFFILDEQRLVGHGVWVKTFLKIAKKNRWILLTATPGDNWLDYAPVFIANGWYKNITEFKRQHVIYAPYVKFPKILRYTGINRLNNLRNEILVEMPYISQNERIINFIDVSYNKELYNIIVKDRWHIYEDRPIRDVGELFRLMRKVVNKDPSRIEMVRELLKIHPKLIIFYNFDYELDILRTLCVDTEVGEWNGHRKNPIPNSDTWVYLVQYNSGSESWNCTETDAMILYSLTYSYKNYIQCQGRIDRLDSIYTKLYYYVFGTSAPICRAVKAALGKKQNFNEREYIQSGVYSANIFEVPV